MSDSSHEQRIDEMIAAYLDAERCGSPPEREALLRQHPDLAEELRSFFAGRDELRRMAPTAEATTGLESRGPTVAPRSCVRYFGDYEILDEIARGGMGVVYRVRQVSLNRIVALKMILSGQFASQDDVRRFRQEAELAANLDHPNIVPIYEVGDHEGQQYFSMKFIEKGGRANGTRALVGMLAKVARAVHYAHQRGVLHRDLKPGNILIDKDGEPHIADFGLAKKIEGGGNATLPGGIIGTPAYMSPEQARAERTLTTAVDIWSLGVILFEELTGRGPFCCEDPLATLMKVLHENPSKPRNVDTRIDRDLEIICLKCLEKEPANRYGSAEALAEDLERWLNGEPILARPASSWERALKWARRQPAAATLALVVLLGPVLLAVGLFVVNQLLREERNQANAQRVRAENGEADATKHLTRARRLLATTQILRAAALWEQQPDLGLAILENAETCPPDLRDFTWGYFWRLCHRGRRHFASAGRPAIRLAVRPDGKCIASGHLDGEVKLWSVASGKVLASSRRHRLEVGGLVFSPDGKTLASGGWDGTLHLADAATGGHLASLENTGGFVRDLAFTPDSKVLVVARSWHLELWDVANVTQPRLLHTIREERIDGFRCVAVSVDGKLLASGHAINDGGSLRGIVRLWDLQKRQQIAEVEGHADRVTAVTFLFDGKALATASNDGLVKLWNVPGLAARKTLAGHDGLVYGLALDKRGKLLASCGTDGKVLVWDTADARLRTTFQTQDWQFGIWGIHFLPNSDTLVLPGPQGGIELREAVIAPAFPVFDHPSEMVGPLVVAADGSYLAISGWNWQEEAQRITDVKITIIDPKTGQKSQTLLGQEQELRLLQRLATGELASCNVNWSATQRKYSKGEIRIWDAKKSLLPRSLVASLDEVAAVALSPDGQTLAAVQGHWNEDRKEVRAGLVQLSSATTGRELHRLPALPGTSPRIVFSPDGALLLIALASRKDLGASCDGSEVHLLEVDSGRVLTKIEWPGEDLWRIALSADGRFLAMASENKIGLWTVGDGQLQLQMVTKGVEALSFTSDGATLASGGRDGILRLWDVSTGQERAAIAAHSKPITSLAFTGDGKTLVSSSSDRTVKCWQTAWPATGQNTSGKTEGTTP